MPEREAYLALVQVLGFREAYTVPAFGSLANSILEGIGDRITFIVQFIGSVFVKERCKCCYADFLEFVLLRIVPEGP